MKARSVLSACAALSLWVPQSAWAVDSYRWLHVTIDTPWAIFIFLLPMVLLPIVLMAILYWRYTFRPEEKNKGRGPQNAKVGESSANK